MVLGMSVGHVHSQDIKNSVVTVEEMLRIDNAQALDKARIEAIRTGIAQAPKVAVRKAEAPLPQWSVKAIYGIGGNLKADVTVDGVTTHGVAGGAKVAMCQVQTIENACVKLGAASSKTRPGSCPVKVCWTGEEMAAELRPSQSVTTPMAAANRLMASPLPQQPLPLPAMTGDKVAPATSAPR